jgi:uncharacterized protein (TIGR02145 family)
VSDPKLSLKPANGGVDFTPAAASATVTINSNTAWAITGGESDSWVSIDPKSGSGTVTVTITVEALPEEGEDRSAVYTVAAGTVTKTITVSQVAVVEKGRLIGGVTWATRNVDDPKKFAKDINATGKVYKFNTNVGYVPPQDLSNDNEASPANWDPSFPPPGNWAKANDPCPIGWHIPTLSEWTGSLLAVTGNGGDGRLLAASAEELSAGATKESDWVLFLPFVQTWGKTQERNCEMGSASRYWTGSSYTGPVPEDPAGVSDVPIADALDYMAHRIFMYNGGGVWGSGFTYSSDSEAAAADGEKWNNNLNTRCAYPVRCVKD